MESKELLGLKREKPIPFYFQAEFTPCSPTPVPLVNTFHDQISLTKRDPIDIERTSYITDKLPGATTSHTKQYETNFDKDAPLSIEECRKTVVPVPKKYNSDSPPQSYQNQENVPPVAHGTPKPSASLSISKSHRTLPHRAYLVHLKDQYNLDHKMLSQPHATKYFVKVRTEISPGHYMANLELHCSR